MSKSIVQYINQDAISESIKSTLGKKTPQFIASIASLVNSNPKIAECDQRSIVSACLIAASLDLPINQNLGFAYIIPYNVKVKSKTGSTLYVKQAQFQIGYKGFVQLAMRSGQFKTINVTNVKEGEIVENNRLTGEIKFDFVEEGRDKLKDIGYVAYMELNNGFSKQLFMSMDDLKKHGIRFSKTFKKGYGLWKDDLHSMATKTVIKMLLSKYAPMSINMITAHDADQAVVDGDNFEYPDNGPIDPAQESAERETNRIIKHIGNAKTEAGLKKGNIEEALEEQDQKVRDAFDNKLKWIKENK